jgi:hypothetical protein
VQRGKQGVVVGFRQGHETIRAGVADQRVHPGKVDVIGDRD